jgi:hypothetical protein
VHVLANVDETQLRPGPQRDDGRPPGHLDECELQGRNVYFQFGHKPDLFQNLAFTTLFLNAIRWASER